MSPSSSPAALAVHSVSCVRLQSCHRQPVYLIDLELAKASGVDIRALRLLNNYTPSRWSPQPLIWGDRGRDRECVRLCVCVLQVCVNSWGQKKERLDGGMSQGGWSNGGKRGFVLMATFVCGFARSCKHPSNITL